MVSSLETGTILELVHSCNTAVGESLSWLLCYTLYSLNMLLAMVLLQCSCPQNQLAHKLINIHSQSTLSGTCHWFYWSAPSRITQHPLSVTYHYSSIVCDVCTAELKDCSEEGHSNQQQQHAAVSSVLVRELVQVSELCWQAIVTQCSEYESVWLVDTL